eukprot:TRINITY_DN22209_c1_g1_i1.p1 TRINITY_DN22209_c1_g1~~TRINITY_DN22209_c1_g1_i1.p1  ORF type:complete len:916 (+),score=232.68 TRINITY_DN22209_c1_g1_i1:1004-3751(+)
MIRGGLRENIICGEQYVDERYVAVLHALGLEDEDGKVVEPHMRKRVTLARAAYHERLRLALLDDPLAAEEDEAGAAQRLGALLRGPLLQGRTRMVALGSVASEAVLELLRGFDRVLLMENGQISIDGSPEEVLSTAAFLSFAELQSCGCRALANGPRPELEEAAAKTRVHIDGAVPLPGSAAPLRALLSSLRDDGRSRFGDESTAAGRDCSEKRALRLLCRSGRWRLLAGSVVILLLQVVCCFFCDMVLAAWTNNVVAAESAPPTAARANAEQHFLEAYARWLVLGLLLWAASWRLGWRLAAGAVRDAHAEAVRRLLLSPVRAPGLLHEIQEQFDGLCDDLTCVDLFMLIRGLGAFAVVSAALVPLLYVHAALPTILTVLMLPVYSLLRRHCSTYWSAAGLRDREVREARAELRARLREIEALEPTVRSYGLQEEVTRDLSWVAAASVRAELEGEQALRIGLINAVTLGWGVLLIAGLFAASISSAAVGDYSGAGRTPLRLGTGGLGLAAACALLIGPLVEPVLEAIVGLRAVLLATVRLHDGYGQDEPSDDAPLPGEDGDDFYGGVEVRVSRTALGGALSLVEGEGGALEVRRAGRCVLRSSEDGRALVPPPEVHMAAALGPCRDGSALKLSAAPPGGLRLEGPGCDARAIAESLCTGLPANGMEDELALRARSGFFAAGAHLVVRDLVVSPRGAGGLGGIFLDAPPRALVGVVGPASSGKSALLAALARVVTPIEGSIVLNGVDAQELSRSAMCAAVGLVSREGPVLAPGSLRAALDPDGRYSTDELYEALQRVGLNAFLEEWPLRLDGRIAEEGVGRGGLRLSREQRCLLGVAQQVLRQPPLLLLDEASEALRYLRPRGSTAPCASLRALFPLSTIFVAARELDSSEHFDAIVRLHAGIIVASRGAASELAA